MNIKKSVPVETNHENLGLDTIERIQEIKEKRFISNKGWHLGIETSESVIVIDNFSSHGLKLISPVELPKQCKAKMFIDNKFIRTIDFHTIWEKKQGGTIEYGVEIDDDPLDVDYFNGIVRAFNVMKTVNSISQIKIPHAITQIIFDMKIFFEKLEKEVKEIESTMNLTSQLEIENFEEAFCTYTGEEMSRILRPMFGQLVKLTENFDSTLLQETIKYFRETLKDYLYQSPYADRVYRKPLGYAGDFEMMRYIYQNDLLGKNLLAKCIHRFYLLQPGVQAVRNRKYFIYNKIKEFYMKTNKKIHALSVACGPAEEISLILENDKDFNENTFEIDLLDQDEHSLQYARSKIKTANKKSEKNIKVNFLNLAIKNVIKNGLEKKYDFIYSAGLFDYFNDKISTFAASQLYNSLNSGGLLLIGNFKEEPIDRFLIEFIGDWYLQYRNEDALKKLYETICDSVTIESEGQLLNLFAVLRKK